MSQRIIKGKNGIDSIVTILSFENAKPEVSKPCLICGHVVTGDITVEIKMNHLDRVIKTFYHTKCLQ